MRAAMEGRGGGWKQGPQGEERGRKARGKKRKSGSSKYEFYYQK